MLAPLIGAFATVAGSAIGAGASRRANDQNYNLNLLNYYQREQERFDTIQQARRQEQDTKLGQTDAAGNRVHFVEGVGWVTELAEDQRTLQDLYQQEELAQLQNDLPKQRQLFNANVERQGQEGLVADALLNAFQRIQRQDPRELENMLNGAASRGLAESGDASLSVAMRAANRAGSSNAGRIASQMSEGRMKALADAFMNNKLNAQGTADDQYARDQGNVLNMYNMLASRASAAPGIGYNPRNIEGMAAQQTGQAMSAQQGAAAALTNAFAKQGGTMQPVQPDYGLANAVTTGGNALSSAFNNIGANRDRMAMMQQYSDYAGIQDNSMYKAGKGLW